jgi:hypothetical protein
MIEIGDKYGVYLIIAFMICLSAVVGSCTYSEAQCKQAAIKAGMRGDEVKKACVE